MTSSTRCTLSRKMHSMRSILRLTIVAVCLATALSFFDFLKSAPAKPARVEQHVDTNAVRGAPQHMHSRYLADPFVCDGKAQKQSIVNDGFCDCVDKSDEPGTSACVGTVFHCINKGYKMVKIPSSRVDDQVCDCCDGSDEGNVASCANTCNEAAEKERAQLLKVSTNYKTGSEIRAELIRTVTAEKAQQTASVTPLGMEIHVLKEEIDAVQAQLTEKETREQALQNTVTQEQHTSLRTQLQLEQFDFTNLAHFLSNLLKTLKINGGAITEAVRAPAGAVATSSRASEDTKVSIPEEDEELDRRFPDEDGDLPEEDAYHGEGEVVDIDSAETDVLPENGAATPAVEGEASGEVQCKLVALTGDTFLQPLCETITTPEAAIDALVNVILKRRAFNEAMLLLGHFELNQSFLGSDIFALGHQSASPDTCPATFETIQSKSGSTHCALKDTLLRTVDELETHFGLPELHTEATELRARKRELNVKLSDVEGKLRAARSASDDMEKYKDQLEYLAMKDQCFDKEDGAFTYSLCILGSIKQKEVVGHREVTLGTFDSFLSGYDAPAVDGVVPSVIMKFGNGQHCHAFGARTATVTVACAAKNALISATEPSTCAYKLHFESPAACTPKYAEVSGVAALGMI